MHKAVSCAPDARDQPVSVLLVEDEALVRFASAQGLRHRGFQVLEAKNAEEACEVLSSAARVDIVVTDVNMPGEMDGLGLARWLQAHRPDLPFIVVSGMRAAGQDPFPFLAKPYGEERLRELILQLVPRPVRDGG